MGILYIAESLKLKSSSFKPKAAAPRPKIMHNPERPRPFTHFIALPVTDAGLKKKLVNFQYKVEALDGGRSIYEEWYAQESTFHFTVLMLPLMSKSDLKKASDLLVEMESEIVEGMPLSK